MNDYKVKASTMAAKEDLVDVYAKKFEEATSVVVASSRGLSVNQDTDLRKQLREAGVELKVVKNSILRRAAIKAGFEGINDAFVGPTAVAFSNDDAIAPAKIIADFGKKAEPLEIKAGIVEGKVSSAEEMKAIAALPSRDGLLSMLLSVLQAPIRNVAYAVKAVADAKEEGAA